MPSGRVALDIELDETQLEKGLDRAARRLSKEMQIPGFRKGKAPRFIVERYFGKDALLEEASNELMNRAFDEAVKQELIAPIAPPNVETIDVQDGFRFRVVVPIAPTVVLSDYHALSFPLEVEPLTEEMITSALEQVRDKHVALRELDEPRPSAMGDLVKAKVNIIVDEQSIIGQGLTIDDGDEQEFVMLPDRLIPGLYEDLLGIQVGEEHEIVTRFNENHDNESIAGKEGIFKLRVLDIQERVLPEWDELPELEEFTGTLEELRAAIIESVKNSLTMQAREKVYEEAINLLIAESQYDIAEVSIEAEANQMLKQFEQKYTSLGIAPEQLYAYMNTDRDTLLRKQFPEAEQQLKTLLALTQFAEEEELAVDVVDIEQFLSEMVTANPSLANHVRDPRFFEEYGDQVMMMVLQRKAKDHLVTVVTGVEPPKFESLLQQDATGGIDGNGDTGDHGDTSDNGDSSQAAGQDEGEDASVQPSDTAQPTDEPNQQNQDNASLSAPTEPQQGEGGESDKKNEAQ
jgi:trigger factor